MTETKTKADQAKTTDDQTNDPRDIELAQLREQLAKRDQADRKRAADEEGDGIERKPYLVNLACGHNDTADNAASATAHYCRECDLTVPVRGVIELER